VVHWLEVKAVEATKWGRLTVMMRTSMVTRAIVMMLAVVMARLTTMVRVDKHIRNVGYLNSLLQFLSVRSQLLAFKFATLLYSEDCIMTHELATILASATGCDERACFYISLSIQTDI
jgi:hypothetical protein